ncbi:YceI family protein [Pannonibacter tanglangensis]|uniref:Polyisoprenoid-binding protein n=1 Tax=Pannonibacter tanglangensis TaxID=2750084 RepID=A0ABW9ZFF0_9HYPH|nr:YceI family protein [Pannonibacter sp. XCT-34]NBN62722.1 polyisoprenoid-binding protein [Pannonibacter sp. XCT-34]
MRRLFATAALALSLAAGVPALAADWTVDPARSSLGFAVDQGGQPVEATFRTWTATIRFDPANLAEARIEATIETGGIVTANPQFVEMIPGADWLAAATFPTATFTSGAVTALGGNAYRMDGTLTLRGQAQPVVVDFTLDITDASARAVGTAKVKRTAFGVGASFPPSTVGDDVTIKLDLTASR